MLKLTYLMKDWENVYHTARNSTYLQYFVKLKSPKCDEVKEKVEKSQQNGARDRNFKRFEWSIELGNRAKISLPTCH